MERLKSERHNFNITDAHLHFFDKDALNYPWLQEVPLLNKNFNINDFQIDTDEISITRIVFVQCECAPEQYLEEVNYVTKLANADNRIQAIIAYFPLDKVTADKEITHLLANKLVKGVRRLEENPSLYRNPAFLKNLDLLKENELSFDICVKSEQLSSVVHLVERQPEISYMLDHLGKPDIKNREFKQWATSINQLATNPNVYCKISGMLNEADHANWKVEDLKPYFDKAIEKFGPVRLVFGSDWPVLTLVDTYSKWIDTFMELTKDLPENSIKMILSENANRFYKLG